MLVAVLLFTVSQVLDIPLHPNYCGMADKKAESHQFVKDNFDPTVCGCFWKSMEEARLPNVAFGVGRQAVWVLHLRWDSIKGWDSRGACPVWIW